MQQTENYQLPQWEATDRVTRADMNAAMSGIDSAIASKTTLRMATSQYTGTGGYGTSSPTTVTFPKRPLFFFVSGSEAWVIGAGSNVFCTRGQILSSWSDNAVSYWSQLDAKGQCNALNVTYHVTALYLE